MHSISSIPFTIPLTCKCILIVRYSCLLISIGYGFTEKSSNFQTNNFGKGSKGNDRITVSVQDKAGMDNADFATPPDGQSGHIKNVFMGLYQRASPSPLLPPNVLQLGRDGALENSIISRYEGNTDGTAYQTSSNLSFNYTQDPTQQPAIPNNIKAAIVNAFYIVNTIHDISYL